MKLVLTQDVCIDGTTVEAGTELAVGTKDGIGEDVAQSILRRGWGLEEAAAKQRAKATAANKAKAAQTQPKNED